MWYVEMDPVFGYVVCSNDARLFYFKSDKYMAKYIVTRHNESVAHIAAKAVVDS